MAQAGWERAVVVAVPAKFVLVASKGVVLVSAIISKNLLLRSMKIAVMTEWGLS